MVHMSEPSPDEPDSLSHYGYDVHGCENQQAQVDPIVEVLHQGLQLRGGGLYGREQFWSKK
jgi:hypothetical protein